MNTKRLYDSQVGCCPRGLDWAKWQEPENNLYYAWSWRSLVWDRCSSWTLPEC